LTLTSFQEKVGDLNLTNSILITTSKLDFSEVIDDRWTSFSKYWNKEDHIKFLMVNKGIFGNLSIKYLISEVQKEILVNEEKIKAIRDVTKY
jgi:iron-sulfur cluster repair protein YtfE (RIC family)